MKNKLINIWNKVKEIIINFYHLCTKNYISTIMSIAVLLVIIGSIVILFVIDANKNKIELKTKKEELYYYLLDNKVNGKYKVNYENDKIIKVDEDYISSNNIIVYYKNNKHVIIPMQSELVILNNSKDSSYSLNRYSEVFDNVIVTSKVRDTISNYFIYDYEDLYFFSNEVQIDLDGNKFDLSPFSYIIVNSTYTQIYDYENDKITIFENGFKNAYAYYLDNTINLNKDVYATKDGQLKLLNIGYYEQNIYSGEA